MRVDQVDLSKYSPVRSVTTPGQDQRTLSSAIRGVLQIEGPASVECQSESGDCIIWLYQQGGEPRQISIQDLARLTLDDSNFIWISLISFTVDQLQEVAQLLDIPQFLVRKAIRSWQRPSLDIDGHLYFSRVTVPWIDTTDYGAFVTQLGLFVSHNYLVSTSKQPPVFMAQVLERAQQNPGRLCENSSFLVYIILDELLNYYEGLSESLNNEIERMEERALLDSSDQFLADLLRFKRYVFAMSQLVEQHRVVFTAFLRPEFPFELPEKIIPYFQELQVHLNDILSTFVLRKEAVNGAFDIYVSQVSHRTNDVIRVLTLISGLLLPVSVVISLLSAQAQGEETYGIVGIVVLYVITSVTFLLSAWIFYRQGWLTFRRENNVGRRSKVKQKKLQQG